MVPLVLGVTYAGGLWFFATIAIVASVAGYEFFHLMRVGGYKPSYSWGLALIWLLLADARYPAWQLTKPALTGVIVLSLSWQLFQKNTSTPTVDWALTIVGGLYLGWMAGHFISLRDAPRGFEWMMLTMLSTWIADTGAYFIGLSLGRHEFFPRLSPKKTWEGTLLALPLTFPFTFILSKWWYPDFGILDCIIVTLGIGILGTMGDLLESGMKREVGLKDASHVFPGHGGFLDRIDSLIFNVPFFFLSSLLSFIFIVLEG